MKNKKLIIIMPAYNEGKVIGGVIKKIPRRIGDYKVELLVVDDASSDNTRVEAQKAGAKVINHRINLGNGGAIITGLEAAKRLKAQVVVTMDADGQHNPKEIIKLIKKLNRGYDIVIGSRLIGDTTEMPLYRVIGNWLLNVVTLIFSKRWVRDSQSGFRAISQKALKKISLATRGFEVSSELVWEAKDKKLRLTEVPIEVIYTDYSRKKGQHFLNAINIFFGLLLRPRRR